jgi:hypothetical protein
MKSIFISDEPVSFSEGLFVPRWCLYINLSYDINGDDLWCPDYLKSLDGNIAPKNMSNRHLLVAA